MIGQEKQFLNIALLRSFLRPCCSIQFNGLRQDSFLNQAALQRAILKLVLGREEGIGHFMSVKEFRRKSSYLYRTVLRPQGFYCHGHLTTFAELEA